MANRLKMAKIHSIQTLHARGWSQRRIARELGIHRETVARYVQLAEYGPRDGPDSPGEARQNQPNLPTGFCGPPSLCEPFREAILAALERGLSRQRIWQDLKSEHGFGGGYDAVKRFCRRLTQASRCHSGGWSASLAPRPRSTSGLAGSLDVRLQEAQGNSLSATLLAYASRARRQSPFASRARPRPLCEQAEVGSTAIARSNAAIASST